ncbi:MAG: LysE family translocator, partial [Gammaproteobacteria bacterium]
LALAIVAGWVSGQAQPMVRTGIVTGVMILFALASNLAYAAAGALLRGWLAQGRRLLMFNRAMALLLVLTAAWMVKA